MPRHVIHAAAALLLALPATLAQPGPAQVAGTVHNLSVTGPGGVRSTSEAGICVFCHTPHSASTSAPLWNRYETATTFEIYPSGGSMQAATGQPNGSSRLCLSCHDGTSALGMVRTRSTVIPMQGVSAQGRLPAGASNLSTTLADDHPVSFVPPLTDPEIELPPPGHVVALDAQGRVQCRSCHDPHDNSHGDFLVGDPGQGALCVTCHDKRDWAAAQHGHPTAPQYQQLVTQACSSCHVPHSAAVAPRLLRQNEETLCYSCHDGAQNNPWEVASLYNITTQFAKVSRHPVTLASGVHNPGEGPINSFPTPSSYLPEQSPAAPRHVECVDCHNPHSALAADPVGGPNGSLNNVWGVAADAQRVSPVTAEYQVCLKCHGDSANRPANTTNLRLAFQTTNLGHHAVFGPSNVASVPSLIPPWTRTSTLKCSDCHGNNATTGPQGPHGSIYAPILKRNYDQIYNSNTPYSTTRYALCLTCHNNSYFINETGNFRYHKKHVYDKREVCAACHNPHGTTNAHMVQMDTSLSYIQPINGRLEFIDGATPNHGSCYVRCHGENHNPYTY
jgi:predicted CXXCH cytochrome family protein